MICSVNKMMAYVNNNNETKPCKDCAHNLGIQLSRNDGNNNRVDHDRVHTPKGLLNPNYIEMEELNNASTTLKSYELSDSPKLGRHWITSRDILEGGVILREQALISGPHLNLDDYNEGFLICLGCNKKLTKEKVRSCSSCSYPVCGEKCEKMECHAKGECPLLTSSSPWLSAHIGVADYEAIFLIRAFLLKLSNPKQFEAAVSILKSEQSIPMPQSELDLGLSRIKMAAKYFSIKDRIGSMQELIKIFKIIKLNSYVECKSTPYSAQCIFFEGSFFASSCIPNCSFSISPGPEQILQVYAATNIAKGEALTINYFDPEFLILGTYERRRWTAQYGFICECERCIDPTECGSDISTLRCRSCSTTTLLPVMQKGKMIWKCTNVGCTATLTIDDVNAIMFNLEQQFAVQTFLTDKYEVLEHAGRSLVHPNFGALHRMRLHILAQLNSRYSSKKVEVDPFFDEMHADVIKKLLQVFDKINPGISEIRASLLNWYCATVLETRLWSVVTDQIFLEMERKTEILQLLEELMTNGAMAEKYYRLIEASNPEEVGHILRIIRYRTKRAQRYRAQFELVWTGMEGIMGLTCD